jgi:hypothetical protein
MTTTDPAPTPEAARTAAIEAFGLSRDNAPALIATLAAMENPDPVALGLAVMVYDHIAPALHEVLAEFLATEQLTDPDDALLFWGLHIMAAARDQSAFPNMLRLLALPEDTLGPLLGEADITTSSQLIAGTFDGDAASLIAFIEQPELNPFIRWNSFEALAFLTFDKRIDPGETGAFLHRFYTARPLEPGDPAWYGWMVATGLLGLTGLEQQVRAAFADELIDPTMCDVDFWETLVAAALAAPDDATRFTKEGAGYTDDIYESLSWVTWNHDDEVDEIDEAMEDVAPLRGWETTNQPVRNPLRDVGRNDPCPCGSGKKYKKCCLPA